MESFHNLLLNRRSIRKYTSQPLDPDAVRLILEAGLTAPTSKNQRSWQFVVVEDKEMLARLGECKPSYATSVANAPMAVVVVADMTKSDAWVEDASVAAIIMQLQAADLGLGSCWVEVRNRFRPDVSFLAYRRNSECSASCRSATRKRSAAPSTPRGSFGKKCM